MGNSNGKIDSTVRQLADVKTVLGESVTTLSGLCKSTKINKWARYKPVILNNAAPSRSGAWWKGTYSDCSLNFSKQTTQSGIISQYNGGYNWSYNPPTGGSTAPYRLYDFAGYDHNAKCFVQGVLYPLNYVKNSGGITITIQWRTNNDLSTGAIHLADFGFDTDYFGVIINEGSNRRMIASNTTVSTNASSSVLIPDSVLTSGKTYYIYPILSMYYQPRYGGSGVTNDNDNGSGFAGLYTLPVSRGAVKVTTAVETNLRFKGASTTVVFNLRSYTVSFTLQLTATDRLEMKELKLSVYQCDTENGSYITVQENITLSPAIMTGQGTTVVEQAYSNVVANKGSVMLDLAYVKLVVTGKVGTSLTYTATLIKQMRSQQEIVPAN